MTNAQDIDASGDERVIFAKYRPWKLILTVIFWLGATLTFMYDLRSDGGESLKHGGFDVIKWYIATGVSLIGVIFTTYLLWRSTFKSGDAVYIKDGCLLINYTFYDYSIPLREINSFRKIPYFNMINVNIKSKPSGLIVCMCLNIGAKNLMKTMKDRIKASYLIDINLIF